MKILSLYYTHKEGGFCKRLYRLLCALKREGHETIFLSLDPPNPEINGKVTFVKIPFPYKKREGWLFWLLFSIWAPLVSLFIAFTKRTDRLLAFGQYYALCMLPAKLFTKAKICLFVRAIHARNYPKGSVSFLLRKVAMLVEKLSISFSDKIVLMTKSMEEDLNKIYGTFTPDISILPNDIRIIERDVKRHSLPLKMLFAGALTERKNPLLIPQAIKLIGESELSNISLTIAGDGPLKGQLKEALDKILGLRYELLGWVSNPSLHEGMPNSVLEALSWGVPVILSDIEEHREIIQSDIALFSPASPESLAAKIKLAVTDPSFYESLASLSKEAAERFSFDWEKEAISIIEDF